MRLRERFPIDQLSGVLGPPGAWQPVPPASDRAAWQACWQRHKDLVDRIIAAADAAVAEPWPSLPASLARRFAADGDRSAWQAAVFSRRERIGVCAVAAAVTGEAHYLADLMDGLWLVSEEASWCIPAHYHLAVTPRQEPASLPRQDRELVDIFAAETGMVVAEAYALHRQAIDAELPQIGVRLRQEVRRRLIDPVLQHDDWFWAPGQHNWSIWIVSNLLGVAGYLLDDVATDRRLMDRCLEVCDRFTAGYAADGACNEGPSYWGHACGSLLLVLECLYDRSAGRIDLFAEPKFQTMCRYLLGIHLDGPHFAVVADSPPLVDLPIAKLARMADRCDEPHFLALARIGAERVEQQGLPGGGKLITLLRWLWWVDPDALAAAELPEHRGLQQWWPSVQLLVARERSGTGRGLVVAAKAGSNVESHNHNDVGQVIAFADGQPLLIDPGTGTYTRQHFSPERYELWTQGALGHNPPVINGHGQQAATGWGYVAPVDEPEPVASEVSCELTDAAAVLRLDASACYPLAAGVDLAQRQVRLDRQLRELTVIDRVHCRERLRRYELAWLTPAEASWRADKERFLLAGWRLEVIGPSVQGRVEDLPLEDPLLRSAWGPALRRLTVLIEPEGAEVLEVIYRLRPDKQSTQRVARPGPASA